DVVIGVAGTYTVTVMPHSPSSYVFFNVHTLTISNPDATVAIGGGGGRTYFGDTINNGILSFNGVSGIQGSITNHGVFTVFGGTAMDGTFVNDGVLNLHGGLDLEGMAPPATFEGGVWNVFGLIHYWNNGSITSIAENTTLNLDNGVIDAG